MGRRSGTSLEQYIHFHQLPRWCLKIRRQRGQQPGRASHLPRSLEVRKRVTRVGGGEGAERVKFEYVFGGVMPSPAGVNASLSKDLDHVGEAEICLHTER